MKRFIRSMDAKLAKAQWALDKWCIHFRIPVDSIVRTKSVMILWVVSRKAISPITRVARGPSGHQFPGSYKRDSRLPGVGVAEIDAEKYFNAVVDAYLKGKTIGEYLHPEKSNSRVILNS